MSKQALGKGLKALIPEKEIFEDGKIINIDVNLIKPCKYQPRTEFNPEKLQELVNSIKEKGVVQPILVKQINDKYELIAGERRLRAVKEAGFEKIPAIIKDVNDEEMLEISLMENLQREELNPIDEAKAYYRLITEFNLTQELLTKKIGKERSTIANSLRLLKLPKEIQEYVSRGTISSGHARAILGLKNEFQQIILCQKIINKGLSVREAENLATQEKKYIKQRKSKKKDTQISSIEEKIKEKLGTQVKIIKRRKKSILEIEFYSDDDLERILALLNIEID